MSEKFHYKVKPGRGFGSFFEHGPGSIVELTEEEAGGFPDILELVKESGEVTQESEEEYLRGLKVEQLTNFKEYDKIPAPKPADKEGLIEAILKVRHNPDPPGSNFSQEVNKGKLFLDRETAEGMTVAELKGRPEWESVPDPKPALKRDIIESLLAVSFEDTE